MIIFRSDCKPVTTRSPLELLQDRYRVRARKARIRVMHAQHQKRSTRDETIEPPTINIVLVRLAIVQN